MIFVVVSASVSPIKYEEIILNRKKQSIDSGQKFYNSICNGLIKNGQEVFHVSVLPISFNSYRKRILHRKEENYNGIKYIYLKTINFPFVRTIVNNHQIKKEVRKIIRLYKNDQIVLLTDALILEMSSIIKYCQKHKIRTVACVTDIPTMVHSMIHSTGIKNWIEDYYTKKTNKLITKYDSYIYLAEKMNNICNPNSRPYMIMECIVTPTDFVKKDLNNDKPIVLYAGKLLRDCGVITLANAAKYLEDICDIWIYGGNSDCLDELKEIQRTCSNIRIHDIIPLTEIQSLEASVDVLINPRPAEKEFVSYSFPSKTAEYLMSGTPTLTFKLPAIPDEYDKYLFYLNRNTPESIANCIKDLINSMESKNKALSGQRFILSKKSEEYQVKRIIKFIKGKMNE